MSRFFGAIPGVPEGATFISRQELRAAKVHLPSQAGISGSATEGADSIVLSGGYEDDQDEGNVIVYTGEGGRDPLTGKQVRHQELVHGNRALAVNHRDGLPVRVTRKTRLGPDVPSVYQYAGLYQVDDHWQETGKFGFRIWRFRLTKLAKWWLDAPADAEATLRQAVVIQRVVRDTATARAVKALYGHRCQVCAEVLQTLSGPYAEAAHIRPLGTPHHGPDTANNILCLCPNHHVLFDWGSFSISDDFELLGLPGHLHLHPRHAINPAHLAYHRRHYAVSQ